jgi:hypothetical protein
LSSTIVPAFEWSAAGPIRTAVWGFAPEVARSWFVLVCTHWGWRALGGPTRQKPHTPGLIAHSCLLCVPCNVFFAVARSRTAKSLLSIALDYRRQFGFVVHFVLRRYRRHLVLTGCPRNAPLRLVIRFLPPTNPPFFLFCFCHQVLTTVVGLFICFLHL